MMIPKPELEEGEAWCYKDDTSVDPDVALSYIGERVQSLLGHHQKVFEGDITSENLGAKYGGYGSFLPSHQRSPSILAQPKPLQRVHNSHFPRSPNACPEGPTPNINSTRRADPGSSLKTLFNDASIKQKSAVPSDKAAEVMPPCKPDNPPEQGTLKVRIKVGPERAALYNAEICNLGLTSPSSSEGNSGDESDGLHNESPSNILEIMTSSPLSGGFPLSPLCEDLLNLAREKEKPVESNAPKNHSMPARPLKTNVIIGKKRKAVDKSGNSKKPENEVIADLNDCKQKISGSENVVTSLQPFHELSHKPLPDFDLETEKGVQVKKRKGSKDSVKENALLGDLVKNTFPGNASEQSHGMYAQSEPRCSSVENIGEHRSRISLKDASVDHGQGIKNQSKVNHALSRAYSDNSEGEDVTKSMDNSSFKSSLNATSTKHNVSRIPPAVNRLSLEGEKRSHHALSRAYSDNSEGEDITKSMDNSSFKSGLNATSTKHNVSRIPPAVNRLSLEGEKSSQVSLSTGKIASKDEYIEKKGVRKLHLSKKKYVENPKRLLETPSSEKPRNLKLDAVVTSKSAGTVKLKGRSSGEKGSGRVSYDTYMAEPPPAVAIDSKEGIIHNGPKQALVAPQVMEDNWVCCDRCEKWRLLPYGTKSEDLPEKWVCSMLDWLPGMNYCRISEDETTKALRDSYLVPLPEDQHNFQTHASGAIPGVIPPSTHHFNQVHENCPSDQVKKHTLKERRNTVSMRDSVPSNGKLQSQRLTVSNENSSKVVKQSLSGLNATNNPDMQHPKKSTVAPEKTNKRKGEDVTEDEANVRKKIKGESAQHVNGMLKTVKTKDVDDFQTLDGKKKSVQRNTVSGGDCQISVKKNTHQMQDLPGNRASGITKIKIKNYESSPCHVKEDSSKNGDFHRDKKSHASQIEEERKSAEVGFQSSLVSSKIYPVKSSIEKEQQQVRKPKAKVKLTTQDIDQLRHDLGCEQPSTAATSSSSKVSGSRKNRVSYMKVKTSPEESVSSSPVRIMPVEKSNSRFNNNVHAVGNVKESRDMNECDVARKGISGVTNDTGLEIFNSRNKLKEETDIDVRRPFTDKSSSLKPVKKGTSVGVKKDFENIEHDAKSDAIQQNSAQMEPRSGKLHIDLRQGDKQGALCRKKQSSELSRSTKRSTDSRPVDASVAGNSSMAVKENVIASPRNVTDRINDESGEQSVALEASIVGKNVPTALKEAQVALREAEELRSHADLFKSSGFGPESNYEYFQAALKFLHGASLLETCNTESSKHVEMSPMQMYSAAAQLCKTCASGYEKSREMTTASLVYKCMEVAYLRVVYCKSSNASRVCNDLQSSLQMAPLGESPSSSASDVDNLNNLVMVDKAILSKGIGGGSHAGSHVIGPRNRHNLVRLLDFTKDATAAMEAAKKMQETFAAANVELEQSQNKKAIDSVKRVINTSFQEVEEFVRLASLAFKTVSHQGIGGT